MHALANTQDFRLAELVSKDGAAVVVVVNKWDRVPPKAAEDMDAYKADVRAQLRPVSWARIVCTMARCGHRVHLLLYPLPSSTMPPDVFVIICYKTAHSTGSVCLHQSFLPPSLSVKLNPFLNSHACCNMMMHTLTVVYAHMPCRRLCSKGRRVDEVVSAVLDAGAQHRRRVSTATLNLVLREAIAWKAPPSQRGNGRQGRLYYATQASASPPSFVLFVNDPRLFSDDYRRCAHAAASPLPHQHQQQCWLLLQQPRMFTLSVRHGSDDAHKIPAVCLMYICFHPLHFRVGTSSATCAKTWALRDRRCVSGGAHGAPLTSQSDLRQQRRLVKVQGAAVAAAAVAAAAAAAAAAGRADAVRAECY